LWGQANPGERIMVEFAGQSRQTVADASGSWSIKLSSFTTSATPRTMTVSGENKIELKNILVGDVWLASGQSNMEVPMGGFNALLARSGSNVPAMSASNAQATGAPAVPTMVIPEVPERQKQEIANANYPEIRLFKVNMEVSFMPGQPLSLSGPKFSGWSGCSPDTLKNFSAVAYYFAKEIYKEVNVPIGIIQSALSGSSIEPWIPVEEYNSSVSKGNLTKGGPISGFGGPMASVGGLYDAQIKPLKPFSLRGFLWYQGESNAMNDKQYTEQMRLLVGSWRRSWDDKNLGFYYVQIAPYILSKIGGLMTQAITDKISPVVVTSETQAEFWEMQARAQSIPNTGMAVITDLVEDVNNIHPVNKWDVGHRLALIALAKSYGRKDIVYSGPQYKAIKIVGNEARLSFNYLGGGLISRDGNPLTDFTIAGSDGKFYPAEAKIVGNKVIVSCSNVGSPVAVRFAWNETAQPNFANRAGLPAVPFRTGP
jgi:sialate O-acetylesterase